MEEELDAIEQGKDTYVHVLKEFYDVFEPEMEAAEEGMEKSPLPDRIQAKYVNFAELLWCINSADLANSWPVLISLNVTIQRLSSMIWALPAPSAARGRSSGASPRGAASFMDAASIRNVILSYGTSR